MSTFCKGYPSDAAASHIHLLPRRRSRDIRHEAVGGFAGPVAPDAPVGTFGNRPHRRWQGNGAFAGAADAKRQGSFGDAKDVEVVRLADVRPAGTEARTDHLPSAA